VERKVHTGRKGMGEVKFSGGLVPMRGGSGPRLLSSRPRGSPPPCRWAAAGWCARTAPCSSPWSRTAAGRGR